MGELEGRLGAQGMGGDGFRDEGGEVGDGG